MRIIAGTAGSIPLQVPRELTRPTTDRVRESLFASLGHRVRDARVLDLFAGSGSLGLECLSRGAREAIFVDQSNAACDAVRSNLEKTRLTPASVIRQPVLSFLSRHQEANAFDLIFADPPYARDEQTTTALHSLLSHPSLPAWLHPEGLLLLEIASETPWQDPPLWSTVKERRYGTTSVRFLTSSHPSH